MIKEFYAEDLKFPYVFEIPQIIINSHKENEYIVNIKNCINEIILKNFSDLLEHINYICIFESYLAFKNRFSDLDISDEQFSGSGDTYTRGFFEKNSRLFLFKTNLFVSDIEKISGSSCKHNEFYSMLVSSKQGTIIHEFCHLRTWIDYEDIFKIIENERRIQYIKNISTNFFNEYISDCNTFKYCTDGHLIEFLDIAKIEQLRFTLQEAVNYAERALYWLSKYCACAYVNETKIVKYKNGNDKLYGLNHIVTKNINLVFNIIMDCNNVIDAKVINQFMSITSIFIQELTM